MFGLIEMKEFVEELGYDKQKVRFWHQFENSLHLGSEAIETDTDIYGIIKHIGNNRSSESECDDFEDSDYDMEEDDRLFEKWVVHDVGFDGEVGKGKSVDNILLSEEMQNMIEGEHSEGGEDSDKFQSVPGSDDDVTPKFPKYNPKTENKNPDLQLGLIFSSKKEAKFVIDTHCLRRGMMYRFDRNDHRRLRARCKKEGCEWYVYVSPMQEDKSWQVKGYNAVHSKCSWNYYNNNIISGWLGKTFVNKFKNNPKLGTNELRSEICNTLKCNVSKQQAYRAKQKAINILLGSLKEHFSTIRDYCLELMRSNYGSTVVLKLIDDESDLELDEEYAWTFMSDKQKGLIPVFESLFSNAENRFCVRNLHSNMKRDGFTGQSLKNALWAVARATGMEEFKARIEQLKELDENAYKWLVSSYLRCYEHAIQGINGAELWPKCELPPLLPPKYENKPGRPKKMRRRQPDEPPAATNTTRMKKCQKSLRCGKCGVVGHNART
ncbi:UNVERIFIED_CONTAM: hypothetical protein Slati_1931000 [Sesamum latifolium]|uniref:Transposase MuDR plant domain-containing protein n=1 Tax=Sesamum latifolium TaxID=2727402 RepID=A0AAW2X7C7_9LAMI